MNGAWLGALVHGSRGAFRQVIAPSGRRKRINPFGQLKLAFARVCDAAGVDALAVPVEFAIWFRQMAQSAFTWPTRETIELEDISGTVERLLPARMSAAAAIALQGLAAVLQRGRDAPS